MIILNDEIKGKIIRKPDVEIKLQSAAHYGEETRHESNPQSKS